MIQTIYIQTIILLTSLQTLCFAQVIKQDKFVDSTANVFHCIPEPSFPGGGDSLMAFIKRNMKWPIANGCEHGTVYITFTIDTSGKINEPKILKGICPPYDKEALRLVSIMPKWNPAIEIIDNKRRPISSEWIMPFKFALK
jgi:hypothetical protein